MRRTRRSSASRSAARLVRPAIPSVVSVALLVTVPAVANADSRTDSIAALIADVARANQRLDDLSAAVELEQEGVNKAMVAVETARDEAAAAEHELEASQQAVKDANAAIAAAQHRFDTFAAATYMNGPSDSYLTATSPDEIIAAATAAKTLAASAQTVMANLERARTRQVNKESASRLAEQKADKAAEDAKTSQDAAVTALTDTQRKFDQQREEVNRLAAERDEAEAKLQAARLVAWSSAGAEGPPPGAMWDPGARPGNGRRWDGWDPTLPQIPSANIPGDPIAVVNQVLGISATSAQVTANMGQNFLQQLGILKPTDTGITNAATGATRIPRVYGRQASEYVIRRGMAQIGVPYSWGGGNAAGPSKGIDSGAGITGFDCSGLVLYSFAGVGIKLPHYSGSQYNLGRKIPTSQMRRGDVIFYGPGGSQHVTLYLGNGQMLEAPDIGLKVRVAPVRTSGMTPFVVRYIEY
ncbi:NlpC/P60 family peptidoglycan endopeptidase RipA [Mycobacterium ulcerans]|uniref:Cell wall-associated hydrolase n=1 Tax=Mycobacterium ulcerans (strain Agy99) TaxID=362242 RepID=A0PNT9_MYCUA|nr:NlpC/P60 family peptidoglycan endopeptidase RipA [Mycobacterium ulcerans]ABL04008.1 cell wall-associated hydrolase [Mycobacterium ulcerans Agy99]MEB3905630.1 NlpC/P60 family peptidoglycan endopeptidase RipA [Mycobacterium ulcerans]MEB3909805.1 NlpC/P60 family peptidoglycan endopeptidase RipA [Mycobacterium ulcerans]MEB3920068.1 NlpC/P60 family peptidoglycan endopeptidase RipA [Mycobacterium ulcerans]MEB3924118.1 NlpC/P60 family peptidoglycan endopeptidase RipA [Mycobacterium ulcerans]